MNERSTIYSLNINFRDYNIEEIPTELEKGEVLLYLSSDMNYKFCKDLNIYEQKN